MPADSTHASRWEFAIASLSLLAIAGVHLLRLYADPLPLLSADFLSDEGWWAHNARNHAIFGHWILDEHNPPIFGAPLWTVTLRATYALFGVGLWETRLPSALAGLATCALVYVLVRRSAGWKAALLGALLLGLDPFSLAHHRSAFVETFMVAWITASFVALDRAADRPLRGALAGALFAAAILAKLWALGAAVGMVIYWADRVWRARTERFDGREVIAFALGLAAVGVIVGIAFVLPNIEAVRHGLAVHAHRAVLWNPLDSIGVLGITTRDGSVAPGSFVRSSGWLLVLLALLLARAILTHAEWLRQRTVRLCLAWLAGGFVQIAWQGYQPDRRWLVLGPPMVALIALAWGHGQALVPTRAEFRAAGRARRLTATALVAVSIGFALRGFLLESLGGSFSFASVQTSTDLARIGGAAWGLSALVAFALLTLLARILPQQGHGRALSRLVAAILVVQAAVAGFEVVRSSTSLRDASRALAAGSRNWSPAQKRIVGGSADSLSLETDLFAFVVRESTPTSAQMNLDGWQRFQPWIAVEHAPPGPGFRQLPDLEIKRGGDAIHVKVWVREEVADEMAAALRDRVE